MEYESVRNTNTINKCIYDKFNNYTYIKNEMYLYIKIYINFIYIVCILYTFITINYL